MPDLTLKYIFFSRFLVGDNDSYAVHWLYRGHYIYLNAQFDPSTCSRFIDVLSPFTLKRHLFVKLEYAVYWLSWLRRQEWMGIGLSLRQYVFRFTTEFRHRPICTTKVHGTSILGSRYLIQQQRLWSSRYVP